MGFYRGGTAEPVPFVDGSSSMSILSPSSKRHAFSMRKDSYANHGFMD